MLIKTDPKKYNRHSWKKNGKTMIYYKLKKALYGTLEASKVAWEKSSQKLQEWGFQLNPYDECVTNTIINSKQSTILWHVDDIKTSHLPDNGR